MPTFRQQSLGYLLVGLLGITAIVSLPMSKTLNAMFSTEQTQGVSGVVLRLQGNQMPRVGSSRTEPEPVSTQVWVFSGRIQAKGSRWVVTEANQHPNLVKQVQSDAQGKFFVSLPPGEYTLFAQYDSYLYLNSFLGDGSYKSVEVIEGITEARLLNTEKATF